MTSKRIFALLLLALLLGLAAGCASGPPPSALERGEAALEQGDWRAAQTHFAQALRLDPQLARAWLGQARAQLAGRDPEAALSSLGRLSQVDPALFSGEAAVIYVEALEAATQVRLQRHQAQAALVSARTLVKLAPERRGSDRLLGQALLAEAERRRLLGENGPALALYREACAVAPHSLEAWVGAAELLLEAGKGKETVKLLEAARKLHPTAGSIRSLTLQALKVR
jgi:tetratricopeptide (TPR) repeat protein